MAKFARAGAVDCPADTRSMVAMYASRGLLVLDNSRIGELGAIAQHAATAAGEEVYKALGVWIDREAPTFGVTVVVRRLSRLARRAGARRRRSAAGASRVASRLRRGARAGL